MSAGLQVLDIHIDKCSTTLKP